MYQHMKKSIISLSAALLATQPVNAFASTVESSVQPEDAFVSTVSDFVVPENGIDVTTYITIPEQDNLVAFGSTNVTEGSASFTDVAQGVWYHNNIMILVDKGVINGYPDGTFKPDGTITRAEFVKLVIAAIGVPAWLDNGKSWPANVISVATDKKINLYGEDVAEWNKPINRADMAKIAMDGLYEIAGKPVAAKKNISNILKDKKVVETSGRSDAIYEAMSIGILNGNGLDENGYTEYKPLNNSKRSEASTIILNMLKFLGYAEGTLTPVAIPEKPAVKTEYPDIGMDNPAHPDGFVNPEIARAKDIEALEAIRCGKDEEGYFVVFTAPDLPQTLKDAGYVYYIMALPQRSNGLSICARNWAVLKSGETKKQYFTTSSGSKALLDADFGSLTYAVTILKVFGDSTDWDDVTCGRSFDTSSVNHMISSGYTFAKEQGDFVGWNSETDLTAGDGKYAVPLNTEPMFAGLADILGK